MGEAEPHREGAAGLHPEKLSLFLQKAIRQARGEAIGQLVAGAEFRERRRLPLVPHDRSDMIGYVIESAGRRNSKMKGRKRQPRRCPPNGSEEHRLVQGDRGVARTREEVLRHGAAERLLSCSGNDGREVGHGRAKPRVVVKTAAVDGSRFLNPPCEKSLWLVSDTTFCPSRKSPRCRGTDLSVQLLDELVLKTEDRGGESFGSSTTNALLYSSSTIMPESALPSPSNP